MPKRAPCDPCPSDETLLNCELPQEEERKRPMWSSSWLVESVAASAGATGIRLHCSAMAVRLLEAGELSVMMMMMTTFITRRGEGQGRTKKGRKATKSEGVV